MASVQEDLKQVPGIKFVDHVAIAVRPGDLEGQVKAYQMLGFTEVHREEVLGMDQVREALLQVGNGPNLIQLLEPLSPESPAVTAPIATEFVMIDLGVLEPTKPPALF